MSGSSDGSNASVTGGTSSSTSSQPPGFSAATIRVNADSSFGNECQDRPGVDEVEGAFGQRIDADVVTTQLDIGRQRSGHPVGVDVGRDDVAGRARPARS